MLIKYPSTELFRVPWVRYHRHEVLHRFNILLEHTIPQVVVDFIFRFMGHSPMLVHYSIIIISFILMNIGKYLWTH